MNKLDSLQKFVLASLSSTIISFLLLIIEKSISNNNLVGFITIISAIIIIGLLNFFIVLIIEKSKLLRRLVIGKDFIEGFWYEIVYNEERTIKWATLINIFYESNELKVNGISFYENGRKVAVFKSSHSNYYDLSLVFQYVAHTEAVPNFIEHGFTELMFENPATSFSGFFIDHTNSLRNTVHGVKVSLTDFRKYNKFRSEDEKKRFLIEKINIHKLSNVS